MIDIERRTPAVMKSNHSIAIFTHITLCLIVIGLTQLQGGSQAKSEQPQSVTSAYDQAIPLPTFTNVAYGGHHRNTLDFWRAPSNRPTPVVVVIHGGGWNVGSKEKLGLYVDPNRLIQAGISVVAINYRLIEHSKDLAPYVKGPMSDAARAVQFIRSQGHEWGIDPARIAAAGVSAGACTSLWLAYHDD